MGLTELRRIEREELIATLRQFGPDAPTLCDRWTAFDIAGHLVTSEAAAGLPMLFANAARLVLPAKVTRRGIESLQSVGDRMIGGAKRRGWESVLSTLSAGPPRAFRSGSIAHLRLVEEWIHHEDVRRGNGLSARGLSPLDAALWAAGLEITRYQEFLPGRGALELATPDGLRHRLGDAPTVRIEGRAGELLFYLAGRGAAAEVTVEGDPEAVRALQANLAV